MSLEEIMFSEMSQAERDTKGSHWYIESIKDELMAAERKMVPTKGIAGEAGIALRLAKEHTISVIQVK